MPVFAVAQAPGRIAASLPHAMTWRFTPLFAMFAMFALSRQWIAPKRNWRAHLGMLTIRRRSA